MRCKNTRTPPSSWLHFYLGKLHVFWSRLIIHSRVAIVAQSFMHAGRVVTNHSVRSIEMQTWATKLILINRLTQIPSNQGSLRFKIKRTLFDQLCLPPMCFYHVTTWAWLFFSFWLVRQESCILQNWQMYGDSNIDTMKNEMKKTFENWKYYSQIWFYMKIRMCTI